MREIKFRAWNGERMVYPEGRNGVTVITLDGWQLGEVSYDWQIYGASRYSFQQESEEQLMQYTGLKDKNGKEIYEGDIIQNVSDDGKRLSKFEIRWQQTSCGFIKEREDGHQFTLEQSRFYEVIGNIYENPELLMTQNIDK